MKATRILQAALVCGVWFGITEALTAQEPRKPVGVWSFEEESGNTIKDSSGYGNDGYIGQADLHDIARSAGKIGKALEFTGEQKGGAVVIPKMSRKYGSFTNGLTIETWIKFHESRTNKRHYEIVSNIDGDSGKGFRLKFGNEWLYFHAGDGSKIWGINQNEIKNPIKPNVWYFLAAVNDGHTYKLYIDGELAATKTDCPLILPGMPDLYIGNYKEGYAYRFDGFIDEVKIFDYARTDAQILGDARAE